MEKTNNFTIKKISKNIYEIKTPDYENVINSKKECAKNADTVSGSDTSQKNAERKRKYDTIKHERATKTRIEEENEILSSGLSIDEIMARLEKRVDDDSFAEVKKYLNYVCDEGRENSIIPANIIIMGENESDARDCATELLVAESIRKKKFPKIEKFAEGSIKSLSDKAYRYRTETVVIVDRMMTEEEEAAEERKKNMPVISVWDRLSESILGSRKYNMRMMVCASYDSAVERFYNCPSESLRNRLDSFMPFRIRLREKKCGDINDILLQKFKKSGFAVSEDFKKGLSDYNSAMYKRSALPALEYTQQLFNRIVKDKYLQDGNVKELGLSDIPQYTAPEGYKEASCDIEALVGLSGVKKALKELEGYLKLNEKEVSETYLNFVFTGNPGTGKTTVARMMANMLFSMGIIRRNTVTEINGSELLGRYIGDETRLVKQACRKAYGGILFIDEAYVLNPADASNNLKACREEVLTNLMREMDMNRGKLCIIFAGYREEMDKLINANPGLKSRIFRNVEFEDYSEKELLEIFMLECKKNQCAYDEDVLKKAGEKLRILKYDDNFGNARTALNVLRDAQLKSLEENVAGSGKILKPEHIVIENKLPGIKESEEALERLTGLKEVKNKIKEITAMVRYNAITGKNDIRAVSNMIFAGNPGTGKTTVARLFGNMLFALGAVKAPRFVSINACDLNSSMVGGVAENLKKYCKKAMGGILFIDEAYAISRFTPSATSDAVNILLDMMENHRDDLVVILAGYRDKMQYFLEENNGLSSRIPVTIDFADYSAEELEEIFAGFCEKSGFKVTPEAMTTFRKGIDEMSKNKDFANARSVRTVFENAYRRHALRCAEAGFDLSAADDIITVEDMGEIGNMLSVRKPLGFR